MSSGQGLFNRQEEEIRTGLETYDEARFEISMSYANVPRIETLDLVHIWRRFDPE